MKETSKRIGKKLKNIREKYGYSLREVEDMTGLHFTNINKVENGLRANLETIETLCNFYKIDLSTLFGDGVEVPDELKNIGVEWIHFIHDMEKKELSPEEIRKVMEFARMVKEVPFDKLDKK